MSTQRKIPAASPRQLIVPTWVRTNEPLLWTNGCGHEIRNHRSYYFYNRTRSGDEYYVLQLTLAGAGQYVKNGKRTLLTTGMAFLAPVPSDFEYGYPPDATEPYEQVFVGFTGPTAGRWCERITSAYGQVLDFGPDNHVAPVMLALTRQLGEGLLSDRYLMSSQLYNLLMVILSSLNQSRMAMAPLITRATEVVHRHANNRNFNVHALADELLVSREHLAREFRSAMRVSPLDYLTQHRLRLACDMLRRTDHKLDTVAAACGFAGANYFCRLFRKHVGMTPAEFRKRPSMTMP